MNDTTKKELQSAAFERLIHHLRERNDVQNIDLMNLAGFCRNCLSKWYREEAQKKGLEISDLELILEEAAKICEEKLLPLNQSGDSEGCKFVDGKVLKKCLGVKNSKEFEEDMKIEEVDELQYDKKGNVTGKNVYTYVIDKDNKRTEIGYKTYRSKNGAAGKTQNTMSYSKDMQDCFKGKK